LVGILQDITESKDAERERAHRTRHARDAIRQARHLGCHPSRTAWSSSKHDRERIVREIQDALSGRKPFAIVFSPMLAIVVDRRLRARTHDRVPSV